MSYCDCDYDYDQPEFFTSRMIGRARKEHRCDECRGPIFIGDSYEKSVGKFDGVIIRHEECSDCLEIREWAEISMPCFCAYEWGSLIERVEEMVDDVEREVEGFREEWDARRYRLELRKMARKRVE